MSDNASSAVSGIRLGIDLGGTKIAGVALATDGTQLASVRIPAPRDGYAATVGALAEVVSTLEGRVGGMGTIGIGMPGSISPATGLVQGSNSTWLNGTRLGQDLENQIGRPVRLANDANCFALSEAVDGAGAGKNSVFGVILGTGCGGGLVFRGQIVDGPNAIGGEWGHNPLPWAEPDEYPGPLCWCGRRGCMEVWVSGTGLALDHQRRTGRRMTVEQIVTHADAGDREAKNTLDRHASRLARGLASVVNIFDPDVIVLGGGLSALKNLYADVPRLASPYIFANEPRLALLPPRWGDASGVRGAAWLW